MRYASSSTATTTTGGYYQWSGADSESSINDLSSVTTMDEKRGSGSSEFSGNSHNSSGSSNNDHGASSPITPFGSSDSNISGMLHAKQGMQTPTAYGHHQKHPSLTNNQVNVTGLPPMKIKVHYRTDLFIIAVPRTVTYDDLADKVGKKIRLCGGDRPENALLKIKYKDEEGDLISLGSNDDVQMAFDTPATLISLWVQ